MEVHYIHTELGTIWTAYNNPKKSTAEYVPTMICLHGNSCDSRIFELLLGVSVFRDHYKIILFDYYGHGRSGDAVESTEAYHQRGYAKTALKVLQYYKVKTIVPVGWSLGGHIALELSTLLATRENNTHIRMVGAVITGTPPIPRQQIAGFCQSADISALFDPEASDEDLEKVSTTFTAMNPVPAWITESVLRNDRTAGKIMLTKFMEGQCSDQVRIMHDFKNGYIAVINGSDDQLLDVNYCDMICAHVPSLWRGSCIRLLGLQHSPFYEDPKTYGELLLEYSSDIISNSSSLLDAN